MDDGVCVLNGDHWRWVQGPGNFVDGSVNIDKIEAGTEDFAEVEAWNAVEDHLEHSDGDELGYDREEGGEECGDEALEDGDQLRGPEAGQRGQGEADDTAQSWRHQDHAAETGSSAQCSEAPGPDRPRVMDSGMGKYLLCKYLLQRGKLANFYWKQFLR